MKYNTLIEFFLLDGDLLVFLEALRRLTGVLQCFVECFAMRASQGRGHGVLTKPLPQVILAKPLPRVILANTPQ